MPSQPQRTHGRPHTNWNHNLPPKTLTIAKLPSPTPQKPTLRIPGARPVFDEISSPAGSPSAPSPARPSTPTPPTFNFSPLTITLDEDPRITPSRPLSPEASPALHSEHDTKSSNLLKEDLPPLPEDSGLDNENTSNHEEEELDTLLLSREVEWDIDDLEEEFRQLQEEMEEEDVRLRKKMDDRRRQEEEGEDDKEWSMARE